MTRRDLLPLAMGALMGAMMLWMLHDRLTGGSGGAGLAFVAAHVAVAALLGAAALWAARHNRHLPRLLRHRPSARHVILMLASAVLTAAAIHLVHKGPVPWI